MSPFLTISLTWSFSASSVSPLARLDSLSRTKAVTSQFSLPPNSCILLSLLFNKGEDPEMTPPIDKSLPSYPAMPSAEAFEKAK